MKIDTVHKRACGLGDCPSPPVWLLRCRGCRVPSLVCDEHYKKAIAAQWSEWVCTTCGAKAAALSDLLDALQLIDK